MMLSRMTTSRHTPTITIRPTLTLVVVVAPPSVHIHRFIGSRLARNLSCHRPVVTSPQRHVSSFVRMMSPPGARDCRRPLAAAAAAAVLVAPPPLGRHLRRARAATAAGALEGGGPPRHRRSVTQPDRPHDHRGDAFLYPARRIGALGASDAVTSLDLARRRLACARTTARPARVFGARALRSVPWCGVVWCSQSQSQRWHRGRGFVSLSLSLT